MSYQRTAKHRQQHSIRMKAWWANSENRKQITGKIGSQFGHYVSEATKEKIRKANTGRKRSPETCERIRQVNLERIKDPVVRERLRKAGLLTPEQRARQQVAVTKTMRTPERRAKHGAILNSPEARAKLNAIMQTSEYKEKMRQNMLDRKFPQKMTNLERLLLTEFRKRRLKFEMNKPMFGQWICDFVFVEARLIVEADGEYWHNRPERKESDQRLISEAEQQGWTVFRFPGKRIEKDTATCARAVARFVRSQNQLVI